MHPSHVFGVVVQAFLFKPAQPFGTLQSTLFKTLLAMPTAVWIEAGLSRSMLETRVLTSLTDDDVVGVWETKVRNVSDELAKKKSYTWTETIVLPKASLVEGTAPKMVR